MPCSKITKLALWPQRGEVTWGFSLGPNSLAASGKGNYTTLSIKDRNTQKEQSPFNDNQKGNTLH